MFKRPFGEHTARTHKVRAMTESTLLMHASGVYVGPLHIVANASSRNLVAIELGEDEVSRLPPGRYRGKSERLQAATELSRVPGCELGQKLRSQCPCRDAQSWRRKLHRHLLCLHCCLHC